MNAVMSNAVLSIPAPTIVAALLIAAVVAGFVSWAVFTARRLDRLHIRLDRARYALEAAMDRRMAVTAALEPALQEAASEAESVPLEPGRLLERATAEEAVAKLVRGRAELAARRELREADHRVRLALRFYNDAVADTRSVRLKPGVRFFRLAGTAPMPQFFPLAEGDPTYMPDRQSSQS